MKFFNDSMNLVDFSDLDIFIMIRKKIMVPYFHPIPSQTREEKGKGYGSK